MCSHAGVIYYLCVCTEFTGIFVIVIIIMTLYSFVLVISKQPRLCIVLTLLAQSILVKSKFAVSILHSLQPHAILEEERAHRRHQQTLRKVIIIDLSLREGRRFLYKDQPSLVLPVATEALRFMTEVYGEANIELTPAYLILAEAAVGKN